jgi:hypothetical protein
MSKYRQLVICSIIVSLVLFLQITRYLMQSSERTGSPVFSFENIAVSWESQYYFYIVVAVGLFYLISNLSKKNK